MAKEIFWRVRSVPVSVAKSLTKVAQSQAMTNAQLLTHINNKLVDGEWKL